MADWVSIKAEYISTGISTRALAEKYGVSPSTLMKRSAAEKWSAERKEQGSRIEAKVKQKTASKIASREVDRITRLLGVGDALLDKLNASTGELGTYAIVKRKQEHMVCDKNGHSHLVEDTVELAQKTDAVINTSDLKRLASALRDLCEVSKTGELKTDDAALQKAKELLGGVPSAID